MSETILGEDMEGMMELLMGSKTKGALGAFLREPFPQEMGFLSAESHCKGAKYKRFPGVIKMNEKQERSEPCFKPREAFLGH